MSTPNIVFTRVDNRLVHGQVGVVWTAAVEENLLLVANDEVANSELQQELMAATAENSNVGIRFWTLEKTIKTIHKAAPRQKIFIVIKTPEDALTLVKGGVPIKAVNLGNMHYSDGKTQLSKKVFVDQKDRDAINQLIAQDVEVFIQDTPDDKKEILKSL